MTSVIRFFFTKKNDGLCLDKHSLLGDNLDMFFEYVSVRKIFFEYSLLTYIFNCLTIKT